MNEDPLRASILLVDDEPELLAVNQLLLSSLGHSVHTIPNGHDAVEYLKTHQADLVILDMVMPGMDGVATLKAIKAIKPDQRVVILSAFAEKEKIDEVKGIGIHAYLQKPATMKVLAEVIESVMAP